MRTVAVKAHEPAPGVGDATVSVAVTLRDWPGVGQVCGPAGVKLQPVDDSGDVHAGASCTGEDVHATSWQDACACVCDQQLPAEGMGRVRDGPRAKADP
jgi:hypothetical protein